MSTKNLLLELFVEELPPKVLNKLGEAFATGLLESLQAQGLTSAGTTVTAYATPRRLPHTLLRLRLKRLTERFRKTNAGKCGFGLQQASPHLRYKNV